MIYFTPFFILFYFFQLQGSDYPYKFEGVLGSPREDIENCTGNIVFFIPYNPVIVEIGGYKGINTKNLAKANPKGHVFVFEPNPNTYNELLLNTESLINVTSHNIAIGDYNGKLLLHLSNVSCLKQQESEKYCSVLKSNLFDNEPTIEVPCVILDDWCQNNYVERVDVIQLDVEGYELQILKSSPKILKNVIVVCTKTNFSEFRVGTTQYLQLKSYLEDQGFELLSHWYCEGLQGEATFVKKYMYDALFR